MAHTSITRRLHISENGTYQYNKTSADLRKWHIPVFQKMAHTSITRRLQISENGTHQYSMTSASNDTMFNMVLRSVNAPKNDNSLYTDLCNQRVLKVVTFRGCTAVKYGNCSMSTKNLRTGHDVEGRRKAVADGAPFGRPSTVRCVKVMEKTISAFETSEQ